MRLCAVTLMGILAVSGIALAQEVSFAEKGALAKVNSEANSAQQILDRNKPPRFSAAHAEFVRGKIAKAEAELAKCPPATHPLTIEAQAKIDKLKAELASRASDAAKLPSTASKVNDALKEWFTRLETTKADQPLLFLDREHPTTKNLKRMLDDLEGRLSRAGKPEDPEVKEGAALLADARAKLEAAFVDAKAQLEALGDWKAELVRLAATCEGKAELGSSYDTDVQMKDWIARLGPVQTNLKTIEDYLTKLGRTVPDFGQTKESQAINDAFYKEQNTFKQSSSYWENEFVKDIGMADRANPDLLDGDTRRFLTEGIEAAKMQAVFNREFKHDAAAADASLAKQNELEAKLKKYRANEEKQVDQARMMKDVGTPEMRKIANTVISGPFIKSVGGKVLRVVVLNAQPVRTDVWEWNGNKHYHRDFDTFDVEVAIKDAGKVEMVRVMLRFSRADWPEAPKNQWRYMSNLQSYGGIREANVGK